MNNTDAPRIIIRVIIRTKVISFNDIDIKDMGRMNAKDSESAKQQLTKWSGVWIKDYEDRCWYFDTLLNRMFRFLKPRTKCIQELPKHWYKQISLVAYSEKRKLPGLVIKNADLVTIGRLGFNLDVDWY